MSLWLRALRGICWREFLRFLLQRGRFFAALVRPLVWLMIFAAGFRSVLGVSIQPPYETYILYEVYIAPGLCGMILLFSGMQGSLSMVYDQELPVNCRPGLPASAMPPAARTTPTWPLPGAA